MTLDKVERFGPRGIEADVPSDPPRFYLGTHLANWLWKHPNHPYFISDVTLRGIKTLGETSIPWALDSGGFTEVMREGKWVTEPAGYVARIHRYANEITNLEWAAPQDWMCGAAALSATGMTVAKHQELTIDSVVYLKSKVQGVHIAPVLQGLRADDYLMHADMYQKRGINLSEEPRVGVGSIFNRQSDRSIIRMLMMMHDRGIKLHAFGFKKKGLLAVGNYLASADSLVWSFEARRTARKNPNCLNSKHKVCNNCYTQASSWLAVFRKEVSIDESLAIAIRGDGFNSHDQKSS